MSVFNVHLAVEQWLMLTDHYYCLMLLYLSEIYHSRKNYGINTQKIVTWVFFYLDVNKLRTDKTKNIYLIVEHFDFIKCSLNKLV